MAYVAWSVVFGEQPTAAKWNILGQNDASFNDGSGIGNGAIARLRNSQIFTASGTWTKPAGLVSNGFVIVEVQAGGGAGGGTAATNAAQFAVGAGAGGGEYGRKKILAASLAATVAVTIGAGGTGVSGGSGNNGGTSSFGAHITALGGGGGIAIIDANTASRFSDGGSPGTGGTGGDMYIAGSGGLGGIIDKNNNNIARGGMGGHSFMGHGGRGFTANQSGQPATNYGAGGGGSARSVSQGATAGGAGSAGIIIVNEYY